MTQGVSGSTDTPQGWGPPPPQSGDNPDRPDPDQPNPHQPDGDRPDGEGRAGEAKERVAEVKDTVTAEAGHVGQVAKEEAQHTVAVAADRAKSAAGEAGQHARELYDHTMAEVSVQAAAQQERLAGGLRSFAGELSSLAESSEDENRATSLVRDLAQYTNRAATWFETRGPDEVVAEVRAYARRRPGQFLAIAAGLGLLAGRVVRGMSDGAAAAPATGIPATGSPTTDDDAGRSDVEDLAVATYPPVYPPAGRGRQDAERVAPRPESAWAEEDFAAAERVDPPPIDLGGDLVGERPAGERS